MRVVFEIEQRLLTNTAPEVLRMVIQIKSSGVRAMNNLTAVSTDSLQDLIFFDHTVRMIGGQNQRFEVGLDGMFGDGLGFHNSRCTCESTRDSGGDGDRLFATFEWPFFNAFTNRDNRGRRIGWRSW